MKRIAALLAMLMLSFGLTTAPPAQAADDYYQLYSECTAQWLDTHNQLVQITTDRDQLKALSLNQAREIEELDRTVTELDELVDEAWVTIDKQRAKIQELRAKIRVLQGR